MKAQAIIETAQDYTVPKVQEFVDLSNFLSSHILQ